MSSQCSCIHQINQFEHHKTKHNANAYELLVISAANTQCESSFSTLNLSMNSVTLVGQLLHVKDHPCEFTESLKKV